MGDAALANPALILDFPYLRDPAWRGQPVNAEPEKCDELRWADLEALPGNTVPYVRRAIRNHLEGVRFDEFGWS